MKYFLDGILVWTVVLNCTGVLLAQYSIMPVDEVPQLILPEVNNDSLRKAELLSRKPGRAPAFATPFNVQVSPETAGVWEALDKDRLIWRLRIFSADAFSLNLGFSSFYLPPGTKLFLHALEEKQKFGPFSSHDNDDHNEFWTPIIQGQELLLEIQISKEAKKDLRLGLTQVNHDYMGFYRSGSCHLDVECGAEEGWDIVDRYRDEIQSVGMFSLNGVNVCSGFLVNNGAQDCRPFFLIAEHCNVNSNNAPSMVVYWNYQQSKCREINTLENEGVGDGLLIDFNSGAIFRAAYDPSDMGLVELDDPVSPTANAFFAGWTNAPVLPADTVICIHHPSNHEKRISFEFDGVYVGSFPGSNPVPNGDHLIVSDWDIGTTESGSSGGPLFNTRKQVIGQVHGGAANCSNNSYDSFGWFHVSWEGGGTPNTRLKDWLDPENLGLTELPGRTQLACILSIEVAQSVQVICSPEEPVFDLGISGNFTGAVTLSATSYPAGVNVAFSSNPVQPGQQVELKVLDTGELEDGTYTIEVAATGGAGVSTTEVQLVVFKRVPLPMNLISPSNYEAAVITRPTFEWEAQVGAHYTFQLARRPDFQEIIFEVSDLPDPMVQIPLLEEEVNYFWRVRGENICGIGPWSIIQNFQTSVINCQLPAATDTPILISQMGTPIIRSDLFVEQTGQINEVQLDSLIIKHTYVGDLAAWLESPAGTQVLLFDRPGSPAQTFGCDGQNLTLGFDDNASASAANFENECNNTTPTISGVYQPIGRLSDFLGENAAGPWKLFISDAANQDGGFLRNWRLNLCTTVEAVVSTSNAALDCSIGPILCNADVFPNPVRDNLTISLSDVPSEDVNIEIFDMQGRISYSQNWDKSNDQMSLDLRFLLSGVYLLRLSTSSAYHTYRFVVQ